MNPVATQVRTTATSILLVGLAVLALLVPATFATAVASAELVMFDSQSCSWCRRWDAEVGQGYPASEEGQRAPLRRVDISRASTSGVRLAGAVNATPTFVLVEGGAEVGRITGYPGADFFWGQLGEMLAQLEPVVPPVPVQERERSASLQ